MITKKTYYGFGLKIVLDRSQVFPDDPGQGTPAMVYSASGASATLWCAMSEGELVYSKTGNIRILNDKQVEFLNSIQKKAEAFLYD